MKPAKKVMYKLLLIVISFIEIVVPTEVTYYEILGVTKQAPIQDIRQAYKKLAVKFHPDKNTNAEEQENFLKITEAYETLKDPEKRRKYDLYGVYGSYTRKYDYSSQEEYNKMYYNGLYFGDPYVETLTGQGYSKFLTEGFHFVNFYSPFCPPCQSLAEIWKKIAEMYNGIVRVGAVNCKHYNNFCYNSMRISSYPSLVFYPNGKNGRIVNYRGDHTLEALDTFIITYLSRKVQITIVSQLKGKDKSVAYILGENRIDGDALARIAYHLNGLVMLAIVHDEKLRKKLTTNDYTTVVYKYKSIHKEIQSTEEKDVLSDILDAMPSVETIDPEKLKKIRNKLRSGDEKTWVLYFSSKEENNKLLLYQMKMMFPDMKFGVIDCESWPQLCASLHAGAGEWGALKAGGAYQRAHAFVREFLRGAANARNLHTVSSSEVNRILAGGDNMGMWVVLVVPYQASWDEEPFSTTSLHYAQLLDIHFGILECTARNEEQCRALVGEEPAVVVQNGTARHVYRGDLTAPHLVEFIDLLRDSPEVELNEGDVMNMLDPARRGRGWLVAHLPARCPRCADLAHQFRIVAKKLKPLEGVRVGVHRCEARDAGFCVNVRNPTARYYPPAAATHYAVDLAQLSQAPYILEWALEHIDDRVQKLNWHSFSKNDIANQRNPTNDKKPWLVYFHSPRCYRCYEMYADFAISGILLNNAVNVGKVNCVSDRGLCQHELISSYPTLKLYLYKNKRRHHNMVMNVEITDYSSMLIEIKTYLLKHSEHISDLDDLNFKSHFIHDEF